MTTFPKAEKFIVKVTPQYELHNEAGETLGLFKKLTAKEANTIPTAIRATLGKSLAWFQQAARPEGTGVVSTLAV